MTRARSATLLTFIWAAPIFWSFSALCGAARPTQAAPVIALGAAAQPLTFDVTARVVATGITKGPTQTITAQVALNGPKARIQTNMSGQPVVVLFSPPYVYRILPNAKSGVRWKLANGGKSSINNFDPQQLMRAPTQIRGMLVKSGAKRTGFAQLNGVPTEVYEVKGVNGRIQGLKLWVRRADALPLRLVANGQGVQVVASWSSYARPRSLPAALFTPPSRYHIRDVQSAPPMAGL